MSHRAFLLLGSNLGDRKGFLDSAIVRLGEEAGEVVKLSSVYQSAPWGHTDQPAFLNQAVEVLTELGAKELLMAIGNIEDAAGRTRETHWGPRTLDIDILLFDQLLLSTASLTIPHPRLTGRRFAITPLAEIAPDVIHPGYGVTIEMLLTRCPDQSEVSILAGHE